MRMRLHAFLIAALALVSISFAQPPSAPPAADDPSAAIGTMRDDMVDAFNKADLDRLLSHVTSDATVTWQNGEVSRGTADIRAYYTRMMSGPDRIVKSVTAAPVVDGRHAHGDWAVSWGHMNDHFSLNDGRELNLDSRFTAVLWKSDGVWKVHGFHLSTDAFHGAILKAAITTVMKWTAIIAGGVALVVGLATGFVLGRRRRGQGSPA